MKTIDDFKQVFSFVEKHLGRERTRKIHIHFSRVEYGKSGENTGPIMILNAVVFNPLAQAIIELGLEPVIICESRGTMAEDALT